MTVINGTQAGAIHRAVLKSLKRLEEFTQFDSTQVRKNYIEALGDDGVLSQSDRQLRHHACDLAHLDPATVSAATLAYAGHLLAEQPIRPTGTSDPFEGLTS